MGDFAWALALLAVAALWREAGRQRTAWRSWRRVRRHEAPEAIDLRQRVQTLQGQARQRARAVAHLHAQLRQARAQARQAREGKQNFLAQMSHEIRTPLNAMLGLGYLAQQYPMGPEALRYLDKSMAAARSLMELINNILEASRLDAGMVQPESVPFEVRELLQDLLDDYAQDALHRGLNLALQVDTAVPRVLRADPQKMQQVLARLLSNALKFTPQGQVTLMADMVSGALLPAPDAPQALRLQVCDTGIGMDPVQLERALDKFTLMDISLTRSSEGVGLGLRVARGTARAMGASLAARSTPGQGSVFVLTVPVLEHNADAASPA